MENRKNIYGGLNLTRNLVNFGIYCKPTVQKKTIFALKEKTRSL